MAPEETIRTSRAGKLAAAARDKRHAKATAPTQPIELSTLTQAETRQDQAYRDGYEILMDLVATIGSHGLARALAAADCTCEDMSDWQRQIVETRTAHDQATMDIARLLLPRGGR